MGQPCPPLFRILPMPPTAGHRLYALAAGNHDVEYTTGLAVTPQTLRSLLPEDVAGNRDDHSIALTVRERLAFRSNAAFSFRFTFKIRGIPAVFNTLP